MRPILRLVCFCHFEAKRMSNLNSDRGFGVVRVVCLFWFSPAAYDIHVRVFMSGVAVVWRAASVFSTCCAS